MTSNRIYILALFVILLLSCSYKRHKYRVDKTDELIRGLDWNSFGLTGTYVQRLSLHQGAKEIIAINDQEKIKKLIDQLNTPNKTVIIHAILTELIEPKKGLLEQDLHYNKDTIDRVTYTYNGLSWKFIIQGNKIVYDLSSENIEKISKYWHSRINTGL